MRRLDIANLTGIVGGPYTFGVEGGQCVAVVGPSGVGKSLLLRMVADLDVNTGSVTLDGASRESMTGPQWRKLVTYVAAEPGWWAETPREHFTDVDAVKALMPELALSDELLEASVTRLSTGEKQRFGLLRAMVQRPAFLLLDEPTSALDDANAQRVEGLLRKTMSEGTGVMLVTHDTDFAKRLGTSVMTLSRAGLSA